MCDCNEDWLNPFEAYHPEGNPLGYCNCFGDRMDECGVCGGEGTNYCDCNGNWLNPFEAYHPENNPLRYCNCNGDIVDECGVCGEGISDNLYVAAMDSL